MVSIDIRESNLNGWPFPSISAVSQERPAETAATTAGYRRDTRRRQKSAFRGIGEEVMFGTTRLVSVALALALSAPAFAADAPGVTPTEIKIGGVFPFSGPASSIGLVGKGVLAYVQLINDRG